jgi:MFS family permease
MILLGFAHGAYWPYLMFGVIGVANVFDDVGVYSSLQQVIPPRLMGRALGVRRGLLLLSMGLGSAVTPWLIDAWGARGTLIATGLLLVALAAAFLPRLTAIDARISAPGPDLTLLRQVSFFHPLPFAIVEHLTSELQSATRRAWSVRRKLSLPGSRPTDQACCRSTPRAGGAGTRLPVASRDHRSGNRLIDKCRLCGCGDAEPAQAPAAEPTRKAGSSN